MKTVALAFAESLSHATAWHRVAVDGNALYFRGFVLGTVVLSNKLTVIAASSIVDAL